MNSGTRSGRPTTTEWHFQAAVLPGNIFTGLNSHIFAFFPWNISAHLHGPVPALVPGHVLAHLAGDIHTLLPWDLLAQLVGNITAGILTHFMGDLLVNNLRNILADISGDSLAVLNLPHPDLRSSSAPGPAPRGPQSINDSIFSNYLIAATKGDHNLLTVLGAPGPELLHQVLALQVPDLAGGPGGRAQPVPADGQA